MTKVNLIILMVLTMAWPVRANLIFDSGYNVFDDSYPYHAEVWVINDAVLDVLGGLIGKLELMDSAKGNVYGGEMQSLYIRDNTTVRIHAGSLDILAAGNTSIAYLYAYDVTFHSTGGLDGDGWIEGTYYSNDTQFSFSFYNDVTFSHVHIVPEPASLVFLGLGVLLTRRKKH